MELIRGVHNLRTKHQGCVLTIGKFDGVHLGHQAVLGQVIAKAREWQLPATVMVFEPQPEEVFNPQQAPARLSLLGDKYQQLKALGVDRLLCVRFSPAFANCSADHFIEQLLVAKLGVRFLVVGDDFRFGKGRSGDFARLQAAASKWQFALASTQSFRVHNCRISSTAIRDALQQADFATANSMLGRPFTISGKVIHGQKRGRTIGFPTANIMLKRHNSPLQGVYAVKVRLAGQQYNGVANIGLRPTVAGQGCLLEVHMFHFNQQIYGQRIAVEAVAKLRDEQKFDSFDLLKQQIQQDAEQAKRLLGDRPQVETETT